jgi:hypothetical protein
MLTLLDFRVRQRDFLLEISRAITEQLDLSEVLRRVLNASVAMLGRRDCTARPKRELSREGDFRNRGGACRVIK